MVGAVTHKEKVDLAANLIMGVAISLITGFLGGPPWAIFGFGYTAFLLARLLP
jgi:hypothetical protein